MKVNRNVGGETRLWFEASELESIMEAELMRADLFPSVTEPAVEIEAFLEFHLQVKLDLHAQLPADVLGTTQFVRGNSPRVSINKDLTDKAEKRGLESGLWGRWRATMAHEAAHVVYHSRLFDISDQQESLFPDSSCQEVKTSLMRCQGSDISFRRRNYDWKEYQANRGMASLLMPSRPFSELAIGLVGGRVSGHHHTLFPEADSTEYQELLRELGRLFQVSLEAASIRMETLGLKSTSDEPMLWKASS